MDDTDENNINVAQVFQIMRTKYGKRLLDETAIDCRF